MLERPKRKHSARVLEPLTRRRLLEGALAGGGLLGFWPKLVAQRAPRETPAASPKLALQLAQRLNPVPFERFLTLARAVTAFVAWT